MALPIKETPILEGDQATIFFDEAAKSESVTIAPEKIEDMKKNYNEFEISF